MNNDYIKGFGVAPSSIAGTLFYSATVYGEISREMRKKPKLEIWKGEGKRKMKVMK
jgi:hypothetical protein